MDIGGEKPFGRGGKDPYNSGSPAYREYQTWIDSLKALRNEALRMFLEYQASPELGVLMEQGKGSIVVVAERSDSNSGHSYDVPLLLSGNYVPPLIRPHDEALSRCDPENYEIAMVYVDNPETTYIIGKDPRAINRITGTFRDMITNDDVVYEDLGSLRIPNSMEEYAKYYEQFMQMQSYQKILEFYKQGQPAVITMDGQPLYQIINTSGAGDESTKPNLALVLMEGEGAKQSGSFAYPKQINLNYGGSVTAYYSSGRGDKYRPVDLGANFSGTKEAWNDTEAQGGKPRPDAISNLEQLNAVLGRCQVLPANEAGKLLTETSQRRKNPSIARWLGKRAR